jgi:putative membrane protein
VPPTEPQSAPQSAPPSAPPGHPDYRFTLANERTLLAWLRTGLALVAGGVAVATYAPDLGAHWGSAVAALALVLLGLGTALAGYERWRTNDAAIRADRPLPVPRLVPAVTLGLVLIVLLVAALVAVEVIRR